MHLKQTLRAYTSHYNELTLLTEFQGVSINSITDNKTQSRFMPTMEYYTDDSMKAIRRKIFTKDEAQRLSLTYSDNIMGLNAYPCNSGLITHDIRSNVTLGLALS